MLAEACDTFKVGGSESVETGFRCERGRSIRVVENRNRVVVSMLKEVMNACIACT